MIAFASSFPGKIVAHEVAPGREIVVQKSGFLAAEAGVDLSIFFQKRIGSGIFGGEGFIMQKLSGRGMAFLEFDGHVVEYELQPGQQIVVDTGYLAAMDATCSMEIQSCSEEKACSTRSSADRDISGCRRCRFRMWQGFWHHFCRRRSKVAIWNIWVCWHLL